MIILHSGFKIMMALIKEPWKSFNKNGGCRGGNVSHLMCRTNSRDVPVQHDSIIDSKR